MRRSLKYVILNLFQKREGPQDMGATATVEIDTDQSMDARAIFEKQQKINKVNLIN